MSIDAILGRLTKCRRAGDRRWTACCPAHEDRSPSLSVRDAGDHYLVHCHAGCSPTAVMESLGLRLADLFPEGRASREYLKPTLVVEQRRRLAQRWGQEFAVLVIERTDKGKGVKHNAVDAKRCELARRRIAGLVREYGPDEVRQIAAEYDDAYWLKYRKYGGTV